MRDEIFEIEFLNEKTDLPLILILEDSNEKFGEMVYKKLSPKFKVLSYNNYYLFIKKLNSAIVESNNISSIIIYNSMLPGTFIQFLSFICSNNKFANLKILYFYNNIIYEFEGSSRIFAHPVYKKKDLDFQMNLISNLIINKELGHSTKQMNLA